MTIAGPPLGWASVGSKLARPVMEDETVFVTVTTLGGPAEGDGESIEDTTTIGELDEWTEAEVPVPNVTEPPCTEG